MSEGRKPNITINGALHHLVILRVTNWDEKGRPSAATIGYDDTVFNLADDAQSREFITAFVQVEATKPRTRGH